MLGIRYLSTPILDGKSAFAHWPQFRLGPDKNNVLVSTIWSQNKNIAVKQTFISVYVFRNLAPRMKRIQDLNPTMPTYCSWMWKKCIFQFDSFLTCYPHAAVELAGNSGLSWTLSQPGQLGPLRCWSGRSIRSSEWHVLRNSDTLLLLFDCRCRLGISDGQVHSLLPHKYTQKKSFTYSSLLNRTSVSNSTHGSSLRKKHTPNKTHGSGL